MYKIPEVEIPPQLEGEVAPPVIDAREELRDKGVPIGEDECALL